MIKSNMLETKLVLIYKLVLDVKHPELEHFLCSLYNDNYNVCFIVVSEELVWINFPEFVKTEMSVNKIKLKQQNSGKLKYEIPIF